MRARARIVFTGMFQPDSFRAFVDHRARRLDLGVVVEQAGRARVGVSVEGEPDLVDAFELACSLGPLDCVVLDVTRLDDASAGEAFDDA